MNKSQDEIRGQLDAVFRNTMTAVLQEGSDEDEELEDMLLDMSLFLKLGGPEHKQNFEESSRRYANPTKGDK